MNIKNNGMKEKIQAILRSKVATFQTKLYDLTNSNRGLIIRPQINAVLLGENVYLDDIIYQDPHFDLCQTIVLSILKLHKCFNFTEEKLGMHMVVYFNNK